MPKLVQIDDAPTPSSAASRVVEWLPTWQEVTITFRLPSGQVLALDGRLYGALCVHATWDDHRTRRPFTVSHYRSRLAACRCVTFDGAVAAAERLWRECPAAWTAWEVDPRLVPSGVVKWCRENM